MPLQLNSPTLASILVLFSSQTRVRIIQVGHMVFMYLLKGPCFVPSASSHFAFRGRDSGGGRSRLFSLCLLFGAWLGSKYS